MFWSTHEKKNNEKIRLESERMLKKHPERCILYVDVMKNSKGLPQQENKKFLVPNNIAFGSFTQIIRKNINLQPQTALFFFVGENMEMACLPKTVGELYEKYKSEDGRMYVYYDTENTFGC